MSLSLHSLFGKFNHFPAQTFLQTFLRENILFLVFPLRTHLTEVGIAGDQCVESIEKETSAFALTDKDQAVIRRRMIGSEGLKYWL